MSITRDDQIESSRRSPLMVHTDETISQDSSCAYADSSALDALLEDITYAPSTEVDSEDALIAETTINFYVTFFDHAISNDNVNPCGGLVTCTHRAADDEILTGDAINIDDDTTIADDATTIDNDDNKTDDGTVTDDDDISDDENIAQAEVGFYDEEEGYVVSAFDVDTQVTTGYGQWTKHAEAMAPKSWEQRYNRTHRTQVGSLCVDFDERFNELVRMVQMCLSNGMDQLYSVLHIHPLGTLREPTIRVVVKHWHLHLDNANQSAIQLAYSDLGLVPTGFTSGIQLLPAERTGQSTEAFWAAPLSPGETLIRQSALGELWVTAAMRGNEAFVSGDRHHAWGILAVVRESNAPEFAAFIGKMSWDMLSQSWLSAGYSA
ncbi:hypothetical protein LTR86_010915 [Recurvomyces mirabilis]|nr:hypothetical protein LTR86_010915 [Recurvomyces mirabilis]